MTFCRVERKPGNLINSFFFQFRDEFIHMVVSKFQTGNLKTAPSMLPKVRSDKNDTKPLSIFDHDPK